MTKRLRPTHNGLALSCAYGNRIGQRFFYSLNVHDKHPLPQLLHGQEEQLYGDCAYASQHELIRSKAADLTNQRYARAASPRSLSAWSTGPSPGVEHVFGVVKRLWGFDKMRYRGLSKNATHSFVALGLANIYLARATLYGQACP